MTNEEMWKNESASFSNQLEDLDEKTTRSTKILDATWEDRWNEKAWRKVYEDFLEMVND